MAMPKMIVENRTMWAFRLTDEERAKLTACARQSKATKTGFLRWLMLTYYDENVFPELVLEAKKEGVTVRELLEQIYKEYRPKFKRTGKKGEIEEEEEDDLPVAPPAHAKIAKAKRPHSGASR